MSLAPQDLGALPASGDTDGDEVFNAGDNCPEVANSDQANRTGISTTGIPAKGDACSCAVVQPRRSAFVLLLPVAGLLLWRRWR